MAKPKMAMIPSTVGGSVYSVLPSNGDGDFDFSRASAATRINAQGLIETVAVGDNRLNYPLLDGRVQTCPHLLLEPQRTNLVTYSESFSNAAWTKSGTTITSNAAISPDGTLNADKLVANTGVAYLAGTFIAAGNTDVTVSFFAKSDTLSSFYFSEAFYFGTVTNFDLSAGTTDNGSIENYGNGWYRCSKTYTYGAGQQIVAIQIKTGAIGSLYIYGAQYEEGSYPTSYIVSNSGSATTRLAEVCNGSGNASTFNDSEGVLMAQIGALANDLTYRSISIGAGAGVINLFYSNVSNTIVASSAGGALIIKQLSDITNFNKVIFKYKQNDFSLWVNGFEIGTDTSGTTGNALTTLSFDNNAGGSKWYGKTKQIAYFPEALTDSELECLTSWSSFNRMAIDLNYTIQ